MGIRQILDQYVVKRNWHYTVNRRLRKRGWDVRPWPNRMALFGFNPELSDLLSQASYDQLTDVGHLFQGVSRIVSRKGQIYSQLCQEAFVVAYTLNEIEPYYLEIGAFHPEKYSNTASLRKFMGWAGLSVDPSKESLKAFTDAGLADAFLNLGVGPVGGSAYFYSDGAFSQTHHESAKSAIEIEILGIRDLVLLNPNVTYVSLDIEGGELEIIRAFPWDICKPRVFTIEHNYDLIMKNELAGLMASEGYRQVLDSVTNFESWFVLED